MQICSLKASLGIAAAQMFQRFADKVCCSLHFMLVYVNAILVACDSVEEHHYHLCLLFERLES